MNSSTENLSNNKCKKLNKVLKMLKTISLTLTTNSIKSLMIKKYYKIKKIPYNFNSIN